MPQFGYRRRKITCATVGNFCLVDDFVQHADVVSPLLFVRLVGTGNYRCRVGRDR